MLVAWRSGLRCPETVVELCGPVAHEFAPDAIKVAMLTDGATQMCVKARLTPPTAWDWMSLHG